MSMLRELKSEWSLSLDSIPEERLWRHVIYQAIKDKDYEYIFQSPEFYDHCYWAKFEPNFIQAGVNRHRPK